MELSEPPSPSALVGAAIASRARGVKPPATLPFSVEVSTESGPDAAGQYHGAPELRGPGLVILRRTRAAFPDAREMRRETLRVERVLDRIGRDGRALLIDARLAPHDTDARLGAEFARFREGMRRGYRALAVLVRTKVGVLQATRLRSEDGLAAERIFDDEAEAVAYLESATG